MIEVKNIKKSFKVSVKEPGLKGSLKSLFNREYITKDALKGVSLNVNEGEILGLIGSNGAGKTTLVKILSGIIHATEGEARVLGYNPWDRNNTLRSQVALIMGQKAQVWWDLPALDSFLLLKEIYQIPESTYKKNIEFLADSLGVKDLLRTQVRKLSLGERMKIELMAALLHNPRVVYLDEPTIGLDLTAQKAIRHFLLNYQKEFKPAMILTSHYMEDIEKLCKKVVIIREGSVVYNGLLEDIRRNHAPEKIITINLKQDEWDMNAVTIIAKELGNIISFQEGIIKIKTPKDNVALTCEKALSKLPVQDLNIENADIADLVEKIMVKG